MTGPISVEEQPDRSGDRLLTLVRRAINDPGAFVRRERWPDTSGISGWEYESLGTWGARAVVAALTKEGHFDRRPAKALALLTFRLGELAGDAVRVQQAQPPHDPACPSPRCRTSRTEPSEATVTVAALAETVYAATEESRA